MGGLMGISGTRQATLSRFFMLILFQKYDGYNRPEAKTFSVDPDLTTFATLRELLVKAFDIRG